MTAFLQRFVNIESHEIAPILISAFFFFCILTALMVLRPAREALGMQSGLDTVRLLFMGTAVATLLLNPVFSFMVSRFRRLVFISATYLFFAASLLVFYGLLVVAPQAIGEVSGRVFYVWFSVFNLFVTMVFWALMADRFSLEQSKRLFGVIAVGGTLGAIFGPWLATMLAEPLGTASLLLVSVAFLIVALGTAWLVARLQPERVVQPLATAASAISGTSLQPEVRQPVGDPESPPAVDERAIIGGDAWEGFRAVIQSRYLLGIGLYVVILAVIATFLYFTRLAMVAELGDDMDMQTTVFAQIDLITQGATLLLQLIVAGHLMKRVGVPVTLALLPITVALGFIGLAIVGSLAALVLTEATFRAVQRALMRPARETLFTVVNREEKYKAKAVIDTFFYRGSDVLGAQIEGILAGMASGLMALASVAVPMAAVWGGLGVWLGRVQRQKARNL